MQVKISSLFLLISPLAINAQLQIGPGTNWRSTATTFVVLNNTDFKYNASTALLENTFKFTGNTIASISGSNTPIFTELEISKSGSGVLQLQQNINIFQTVRFHSGLFDIGNYDINMGTNALIKDESETSRFISSGTGKIIIIQNLNAPNNVNPGNLGAIISSNINMGSVIIRRGHQIQTNGGGGGNSVRRYYDIEPTNNNGLNATLTFSYWDAELNGLNESTLTIWKSGNNTNWQNLGFTSRNTTQNTVSLSGINDFSRWTLSTPGNALPLIWNSLSAHCATNKVVLSWKTVQEYNTLSFTIEKSVDGLRWNSIGTITAAGNSTTVMNYSFEDLQFQKSKALYRIRQTDIDGKFSYSTILHTDCDNSNPFKVYPRIVDNMINIVVPFTPPLHYFIFRIIDAAGKTVMTDKLPWQNQQISLASLRPGFYIIELSRAKEVFSTKIIKQ